MKKGVYNNVDFNLPIKEFVEVCHEFLPAEYGKMMVKKIQLDSKYKMKEVNGSNELGDLTIKNELYYEVKTSYLNKNGSFGIKNIRGWQKFDYFILCLIDTSMDKYRPYFYCVEKDIILNNPILKLSGQNNTKESNMKNTEVGQSTSFKLEDHKWLFKSKSKLKGTNYEDLMEYIDNTCFVYDDNISKLYYLNSVRDKIVNKVERMPIQKIRLDVGGKIIDGVNNKEVMVNMVKYVGSEKLDGVMWPKMMSKYKSEDRCYDVGNGYYFNPKFSLRDVGKLVRKLNKVLNLNIQILKK